MSHIPGRMRDDMLQPPELDDFQGFQAEIYI